MCIKNILIVTSWSFDDALIQTYTLPYVKIIKKNISKESKIYIFTLEKNRNDYSEYIKREISNLKNENIFIISKKYSRFGIAALFTYIFSVFQLSFFCFSKKISTIHTWCTPAGAMGYLISVLTGKNLIIDSFEPHAEPMVEGSTWKKNSFAYKILFFFEKLQLKKAKEVICATEGMIAHSQKKYGIIKQRYFVKPACVNLDQLSDKNIKQQKLLSDMNFGNNDIICVYAGKFGGLYLEDEIFQFFKTAYNFWGARFKVLLLSSITDEELKKRITNTNLNESIFRKVFVGHNEIANYMGMADFAICPMKPLPSRRYGTPIKNGEYWALGLPIVITKNISDDSDIIEKESIGYVLKELNQSEYINAVTKIDELISKNSRTVIYKKIRPIAEKYRNFSIAENIYKNIYGNT